MLVCRFDGDDDAIAVTLALENSNTVFTVYTRKCLVHVLQSTKTFNFFQTVNSPVIYAHANFIKQKEQHSFLETQAQEQLRVKVSKETVVLRQWG